MNSFSYSRPTDEQTALREAAQAGARFLAGGTNLLDLMKYGVEAPRHLVDIRALSLRGVEELSDGTLRMGALTTNTEVAWHPLVREKFPVLSEALLAGATPQLRNMATIGGNMLQRTRCPYFYDIGTPCNKREPGTGCSAIPGWHRLHAIFGTSEHCIAAHPSDLSVALAALDARVHTIGIAGECEIAFTDLHCQPGETPQIETVLRAGELITAVTIPPLSWARYSHYRKVRDRASYDFALVSAAVALHTDHGMIRDARIALGGVGTKPWRAYPAEQVLTGRPAEPATFEEAGKAATDGAKPGADNAFKVELTRHTVAVALRELVSA